MSHDHAGDLRQAAGAGDSDGGCCDLTPTPNQARPHTAQPNRQPLAIPTSDRFPDIPCVNWSERGRVAYGGQDYVLHGRALALVLWIAHHQDRVNESRAQAGQLFATWKGGNFISISGHVKVRF